MPYTIKCWIPIDEEEPQIYDAVYMAIEDLNELEGMQPENRYEIVECDKQGRELLDPSFRGV